MSDIVNTAEIRVVADASGVEAGLRPAVDAANRAGQAIRQTGSNANGAARAVESAQRNIIASIQRTTMAMEAGGRGTSAYYDAMARARNVDPTSLAPYLNQLRAVEAAQTQAAESARTQAAATREVAQAQATKDAFIASLREQVALFGKSADEVLRYRAAQAGASQEAAHLILQLQNMRAAQEQVEASARALVQAQREAAQANASRDAFIQSLREQIQLFGLSTEEVQRYRAAQLGAAQAADPLIAQLRDLRLAQEQAAYGARMEAQAQREAAQARAGRDSFLKGLEQQASAIGKTRAEFLELQAAQLGVSQQAKPFIDQLRAAEQGLNAGGMSARQMNAALRGVPAQMTDIIVSLQGGMNPMTVFLQQGGQLKDMFGGIVPAARALGSAVLGLINPYTVTTAAAAAWAVAFKAGHDETIRYSRALIMTGNIAGTTAGQMADMANRMEEVNGSQAKSAKALTTLASTGAIARADLEKFGTVSVDAQRVLGQSVEDTAKEFAALGKDPLTTLRAIGDKYNFVSTETYRAVKAAQEQGRTIDAASIAQNAYADGVAKQNKKVLDSLSAWERGWIAIKTAISGAIDATIEYAGGREEGPQTQIDALEGQRKTQEARVKRLKEAGERRDGEKYDPSRDRNVLAAQAMVDMYQRQIDGIRQTAKATDEAADAEAKRARAQATQRRWDEDQKILKTRRELMEMEIEAAKTEGRTNGIEEVEINKQVLAIRRKYNDVFVAGIDASMTSLRKRGELENVLSQRALAQIAAQRDAGALSEDEAIRRTAAEELAQMDAEKARLEALLALTSKKINSDVAQRDLAGQIARIGEERISREKQLEDDLAAAKRKRADASDEIYQQGILAAQAELKSLMDLVDAQVLSNAEIGLSKTEVADLAAKRLIATAAAKEQTAAELKALPGGRAQAEIYRQQAAELRKLATAKQAGAVKQEVDETSRKALEDLNKFLDPTRAQTFGEALREAFGSGGEALSKLMANLDGYGRRQAEIAKHRETAEKNRGSSSLDEIKYLEAVAELGEREVKNRLQGYGDMASAAKGFFSDGSKGYKMMEGAERAFRVMELASQMESLYTHLFVTTSKATATATGQAVETGAVVAGEAARNTAKVPGVFMAFMSALGPWGMAAAGAAIAAVLGGAFSGGGGGMSLAESRQKTQGTGTVLGSDAKSESIDKSLQLIKDATFQGLSISGDMLAQLRSIDSNLTGFSSLVVQTTSIKGSLGAGLESGSGGFWGKLGNSIFGGKTTVEDSGFSMNAISFADIFQGKVNSYEYADTKKSGGWFSSDKRKTEIEGLGLEGNRQIALVLTSLYEAVESAGGMLDIAGDDFTSKLNSFVVDIGKVSLKGLSGEEIEKEIQAVFSKVGDQLAAFSIEGLGKFQQTGEGYLETLARIAIGYQTVTVVADSLGMPFDAIGMGSIEARQRLIDLAGGLDEFKESADSFMSDFFTEKERADALRVRLQPTLDRFGIQTGADDSMQQFRDVVKGLRLETAEGARDFSALMDIMPAFKQLADFDKAKFEERLELQDRLDELTLTSAQLLDKQRNALDESNRSLFDQIQTIEQASRIADERKGLQDEYDQLTMSSEQLLQKQRDALDGSNRSLFDQIQAVKAATEAQKAATTAQQEAIQANKQRGADLLAGVDSAFSALQSVVGRERGLLQESANAHRALSSVLSSTLDGMKVSGQEREDRAGAQAQIRAALAIAKASGVLPDVDGLKGALSVVGKDSASLFSTQEEYLRDFYSTQNDIADLAGLTDKTLSVEEQSIKRLDDILANAQQQVDVLKGLDTTMLTLVDVMRGLDRAIGAAQADPVASAGSNLAKLYKDLLGRAPDASGLAFYKDRMAEGVTLEQIRDDIMKSLEYKDHIKGLRGFAVGTNYVPTNMPAMIHEGERIIPAADNRELMRRLASPSENNSVLAAAVERLTATVERQERIISNLQSAADRTQGNTKRLADGMEILTEGYNAMRTKEETPA